MKRTIRDPYKIFFETLGNRVRWEVIHLLQKGELNATGVAEKLGYEQSLISHHLQRLEKCGFVTVKRNGKERIYTLNKETVKPLLELMDKHISTFCKKLCS